MRLRNEQLKTEFASALHLLCNQQVVSSVLSCSLKLTWRGQDMKWNCVIQCVGWRYWSGPKSISPDRIFFDWWQVLVSAYWKEIDLQAKSSLCMMRRCLQIKSRKWRVDQVVERQGYYSRDGSLRSKRFLRVFSAKRGARAKKNFACANGKLYGNAFCVYAGYRGTGMEVCCFPRFSHRPLWPSDLGYELIMRNAVPFPSCFS